MSWILKNKKKICILGLFAVDIVLLILHAKWWLLIHLTINIVCFMVLLLNRQVNKILLIQKAPFGYKSRIRNVDCLIIGDMCSAKQVLPENCHTFVQISAPERSLLSSFEILKHTSSILKEKNGEVIIVCKQKNVESHRFSVFDIPFFVGITLKKYGIEYMKNRSRAPFLINPICSLKLIYNQCQQGFVGKECPWNDVIDFCKERDTHLTFMTM